MPTTIVEAYLDPGVEADDTLIGAYTNVPVASWEWQPGGVLRIEFTAPIGDDVAAAIRRRLAPTAAAASDGLAGAVTAQAAAAGAQATATSAEQRSTGVKPGAISTAMSGARAALRSIASGGVLEFFGRGNVATPAFVQGIVDEARQVLKLSSGTETSDDTASEVVLRSGGVGAFREVAFYTGRLSFFGEVVAAFLVTLNNGLRVAAGGADVSGGLLVRGGGINLRGGTLTLPEGLSNILGITCYTGQYDFGGNGQRYFPHGLGGSNIAVTASLVGQNTYKIGVLDRTDSGFTLIIRDGDNQTATGSYFVMATAIRFNNT